MSKVYGSDEVYDAMWELQKQGFYNPSSTIRTNPLNNNDIEVWLWCEPKENGEYPDIEIDDVANWAMNNGRNPEIAGVCNKDCYWWVFD